MTAPWCHRQEQAHATLVGAERHETVGLTDFPRGRRRASKPPLASFHRRRREASPYVLRTEGVQSFLNGVRWAVETCACDTVAGLTV